MSNPRNTIGLKPETLLPQDRHADRPLFVVMMIMVFLACLAAIATHASYRAASSWGDDLKYSATIQIKPDASQDGAALANRVTEILKSQPAVSDARPLTQDRSAELLQPWIGDIALPEDLPLPYLVDVTLHPGQDLDIPALKSTLSRQGINADIDDHGRWSRDIARTTRAARLLAITALLLLIGATSAAAGFATQSGLAARKTIIDVLSQVGAYDSYIATLFTRRFAVMGIKAGIAGAILAGIIACLFWLLSGRGSSALLPRFAIDYFDLMILVAAPFIAGVVSAIAARYTVLATLKREAI